MNNVVNNILVRGKHRTVVNIPEKEHDNGTLWIKIERNLFGKEEKYVPYTEKNINKRCWDIDIKQNNYIKDSFVKGFSSIIIKLNKNSVYECYAKDLDYAFNKARGIIYELDELMDKLKLTSILHFEKLKERKVYFKELPGIINGWTNNGRIHIKPDCKEEDLDNWWKSVKFPSLKNTISRDVVNHKKSIAVDLLDKRINWDSRHDRRDKIINIMNNVKG